MTSHTAADASVRSKARREISAVEPSSNFTRSLYRHAFGASVQFDHKHQAGLGAMGQPHNAQPANFEQPGQFIDTDLGGLADQGCDALAARLGFHFTHRPLPVRSFCDI